MEFSIKASGLQYYFNLAYKFNLFDFKFDSSTTALLLENRKTDSWTPTVCLLLITLSFIRNVAEIVSSVFGSQIVSALFNIHAALFNLTLISLYASINQNPENFVRLFNFTFGGSKKIQNCRKLKNKQFSDLKLILLAILTKSTTFSLVMALHGLPLFMPCLHKTLYYLLNNMDIFSSCQNAPIVLKNMQVI